MPLTAIARVQQNLTVSGRAPVTAVLLCPTRESASFVASEAKLLLMFHPGIRVQVLKGGNDMRKEARSLQSLPCHVGALQTFSFSFQLKQFTGEGSFCFIRSERMSSC